MAVKREKEEERKLKEEEHKLQYEKQKLKETTQKLKNLETQRIKELDAQILTEQEEHKAKEEELRLKEQEQKEKEIILSPNFINDEAYLERFRLAAYHCLNWFPDIDAGTTVSFESETSNLINFNNMPDGIPSSFINGTIRINDA